MKRWAYLGCAAISLALAGGVLYVYGVAPATLAMALVLLLCPVLVVWLTFYLARRSEDDIDQAMHRNGKK